MWNISEIPNEPAIRELADRFWAAATDRFAEAFYRARLEWQYDHAPNEQTQWLIQEVYW